MKVLDAHGEIAQIKRRLNPQCAVRRSPYCEAIIAMRLAGTPLIRIEEWLIKQGPEHRISAPSLYRNLKQATNAANLKFELPVAEEMAERWGGTLDVDLERSLAGEFVLQRQRIDVLRRRETERRKTNPDYHDKRIATETAALLAIAKTLRDMVKGPEEAKREYLRALEVEGAAQVEVSGDAEDLITDLLITGQITMGTEGVTAQQDS